MPIEGSSSLIERGRLRTFDALCDYVTRYIFSCPILKYHHVAFKLWKFNAKFPLRSVIFVFLACQFRESLAHGFETRSNTNFPLSGHLWLRKATKELLWRQRRRRWQMRNVSLNLRLVVFISRVQFFRRAIRITTREDRMKVKNEKKGRERQEKERKGV